MLFTCGRDANSSPKALFKDRSFARHPTQAYFSACPGLLRIARLRGNIAALRSPISPYFNCHTDSLVSPLDKI